MWQMKNYSNTWEKECVQSWNARLCQCFRMEPKENIFGSSKINRVNTGDIVRWHTIKRDGEKEYLENIGIITNVYIDVRGGRQVAMAKVIPLGRGKPPGIEIEIFLACVKVISKA